MLSCILFLLAAISTAVLAKNPVIVSPVNGTYNAGDTVVIKWVNATTGFLNIDLVNAFSEVLSVPLIVALGVPASQGSYTWKVPELLKTAVGYQLRVWGLAPPLPGSSQGISPLFTIFNNVPKAINAFKVLTPSGDEPCYLGKPCKISWDYPETINGPAYVHLRLFKAGSQSPVAEIADVPAAQKSYVWTVPSDNGLVGERLYVSVSGAGTPPAGPGFSNEMGGNGVLFGIAAEPPAAQGSEKNADFEQQDVIETETVTVTTNTVTVKTTITENSAVPARSASAHVLFLLVPLVVLLF